MTEQEKNEFAKANPLGEILASPSRYDPTILYPISRAPARANIAWEAAGEVFGFDHWQAFELSWLNSQGKPQVAIADLFFQLDSPAIVESKSLKLYLNSFNAERFDSPESLAAVIAEDLGRASSSAVTVRLHELRQYRETQLSQWQQPAQEAVCLDDYEMDAEVKPLDASILNFESAADEIEKVWVSDLFRSNCPVTNQPDWASIEIRATGIEIDPGSLLSYLCSFRNHQGYHEECAERIYCALQQHCAPQSLSVSMNYLRRGGLDINVYRGSQPLNYAVKKARSVRQ